MGGEDVAVAAADFGDQGSDVLRKLMAIGGVVDEQRLARPGQRRGVGGRRCAAFARHEYVVAAAYGGGRCGHHAGDRP